MMDKANQVPLAELLRRIPEGLRVVTRDGPFASSHHPIGFLARKAADRISTLEAALARVTAERDAALSYAKNLAVSMHHKNYLEEVPGWQPLPDLLGLLTQIDNMYTGVRSERDALREDAERYRWLRDGCAETSIGVYEWVDRDGRQQRAWLASQELDGAIDAAIKGKWALTTKENA